jgi:hypothetical protein
MMRPHLITAGQNRVTSALLAIFAVVCGGGLAVASQTSGTRRSSPTHFAIQVVDRQTGRGVPLVQLRTTNNIRYVTDSHGIVAFHEPGLMDREVFFFVESHGYEFPKDGFGFRGKRLRTAPGRTATLKVTRLNIAERLYRITGQGIYRDSVLTGRPVPLQEPVLNGQVAGQDSVYTCIYHGRLFWLWGDTSRPSYPLGHFATAGARSDLPGRGGLDPAVGVDLEYFVDENGFSRPIAPLTERGLVWLDGLLIVADREGHERMVAKFARMKDLGTAYERGLMVFNDATDTFEPVVRSSPDFLPYTDSGHALAVDVEGRRYHYFATQFPLTVRMRVRSEWDFVIDPNRYEVLTSLGAEASNDRDGRSKEAARWVAFGDLLRDSGGTKASVIRALKREKERTYLCDIESGKRISPHGGGVSFNAYRGRWIMIVVQSSGDNSHLGEIWYAEADTPVGPWAYARKIVTHKKYSFYNPMHHPYFDQDGGRIIFFEGTYSHTFSGSREHATPRYDYNQIMYRLSLDDPRLVLPTPVYQLRDRRGANDYLLRSNVERTGQWDRVESVPFLAMESNRGQSDLVAVYAQDGSTARLTTERPTASSSPLFFALPEAEGTGENTGIVDLFEYRHADSGEYLYATDPQLSANGWKRGEKPLCRVWRTPPGPLLLDGEAAPASVVSSLEDAAKHVP